MGVHLRCLMKDYFIVKDVLHSQGDVSALRDVFIVEFCLKGSCLERRSID